MPAVVGDSALLAAFVRTRKAERFPLRCPLNPMETMG